MIDGHEKFQLKSEGEGSPWFIEVNWQDDPKTNQCKILKITFPNGDTSFIKKEHLLAVLFAIGSESEQQKMIPQKLTRSKWYETVLSVKATKDIRRGESIIFPVKITLPAVEEEVIKEMKKDMWKTGLARP